MRQSFTRSSISLTRVLRENSGPYCATRNMPPASSSASWSPSAGQALVCQAKPATPAGRQDTGAPPQQQSSGRCTLGYRQSMCRHNQSIISGAKHAHSMLPPHNPPMHGIA
jgi:hypothetical protein